MKFTHLLIALLISFTFFGIVIATGTEPTITARNITEFSHNVSVQFNSTGNGTISINNTVNWTINSTGFLINITLLI